MTREEFADIWARAREMLASSGARCLRLDGIPFMTGIDLNIRLYQRDPQIVVDAVRDAFGGWDKETRRAVLAQLDEIMPGRRWQIDSNEFTGTSYVDGGVQVAYVRFLLRFWESEREG